MSLLLDALRQAEQNKTKHSENTTDLVADINAVETTSDQENEQNNDSRLIELDILPDFELTADFSPIKQDTSNSKEEDNNIQAADFHAVEPLAEETIPFTLEKTALELDPEIVSAKAINLVDTAINDNDIVKSEEEKIPSESSIKKSTIEADEIHINSAVNDSVEETDINKQQDNEVPEQKTSDSSEETYSPATETEIAKKILISSDKSKIKPIYWVLLLLLIAIISAAYYLYSLTLPPPQSSYANIDSTIDPGLVALDGEITTPQSFGSTATSTKTSQQVAIAPPPPKTQNNTSSVIKDKQVPINKAINNPSTFGFTIETESKGIEYPKAVKIKRKKQARSEFTALNTAYDAYLNHDLDKAQTLYSRILQKNHRNIDALNAMGMLAEQKGHKKRAKLFFEQVLQLDGNQMFAQQALIRLQNKVIPSKKESHYKSLIHKFPDNAPSYAALANLYSSQQQWLKAQKSYFKAIEIDSNNPDYHYNLAITLDHLSKPKIALRYYQKALQLSTKNAPMFSILALQQRIQQLQDR